jgi:ABC-type antimicrobial peptide transport system permease subunit
MVYYPQAHLPISFGTFVVRTKNSSVQVNSAITAAIQQVKPDQPVEDVLSMNERIGSSYSRMRFQTALLASFAGIAVLLALIGVYGVMAYSIEQRTHEIGVRLALGAHPSGLRNWITARGLRLASVGLAAGLIVAFASTRVLGSLLYDIRPNDPLTFIGACLLLAAACLMASYLPARRATLVDPAITLRGE